MSPFTFLIRPEAAEDEPLVDALNDLAFGPGRFARTAYRLREGVPHEAALAFVAFFGSRLGGSVRQTPVLIGGAPALMLGPLAVHPDFEGRGAGRTLVRTTVDAAWRLGHRAIVLVGDAPYYGPLGFERVPAGRIVFPGPVDPARIMICELQPAAAAEMAGAVTRAG